MPCFCPRKKKKGANSDKKSQFGGGSDPINIPTCSSPNRTTQAALSTVSFDKRQRARQLPATSVFYPPILLCNYILRVQTPNTKHQPFYSYYFTYPCYYNYGIRIRIILIFDGNLVVSRVRPRRRIPLVCAFVFNSAPIFISVLRAPLHI
jgi:hypothetical protein